MSKILSLFVVAVLALVALAIHSGVSAINYNFQLDMALNGLKYAKVAYCDASAISDWSCPACPLHPNFKISKVYDNVSLDSQAFTGYDSTRNEIVVSFRGSQNIINWIDDFTFEQLTYPYCNGCLVHKGFWEEWQSYEVPIIADIRNLVAQHPSATLFVTGHSLGAAVAVHAAATFNRIKIANTITEYSFGTPRTGNPAFSEWVFLMAKSSLGHTQRIVNRADIVPHLPPMTFGSSHWLHTPHETWMKDAGTSPAVNCNDGSGYEDPACSDSVIIPSFSDHTHYLGMRTECNMLESEPAANTKDFTPEQKIKFIKMLRQDKIRRLNKKKN